MDPVKNPFTPGAGTPPPALVGRDDIVQAANVALRRIIEGKPEKSQILLGLRGVGKTVLLNRIKQLAGDLDYQIIYMEAPEDQRLAEYLVPNLKSALTELNKGEKAKEWVRRGLSALKNFADISNVSIGKISITFDDKVSAGSGNLEVDLPELFLTLGKTARAADSKVAIFLDEVQYLVEEDLRGLIVALHRLSQENLPVILFGAGLPQVAGLAGNAKSYAERLFDYPGIGKLTDESAGEAIKEPLREYGGAIDNDALKLVLEATQGYPYFLQEWGKHTWNKAESSPIDCAAVHEASKGATEALDKSFFRVRFDRLTPRERDYLYAMAKLGPGPHRSGDIAKSFNKKVDRIGPLRSSLIKKGMLWSPAHGDTAFTVPLFDAFMKRANSRS